MASNPPTQPLHSITVTSISTLVALVTDQNPDVVRASISDDQAQTFALNISNALFPDEVFPLAALDAWAIGQGYTKSEPA